MVQQSAAVLQALEKAAKRQSRLAEVDSGKGAFDPSSMMKELDRDSAKKQQALEDAKAKSRPFYPTQLSLIRS